MIKKTLLHLKHKNRKSLFLFFLQIFIKSMSHEMNSSNDLHQMLLYFHKCSIYIYDILYNNLLQWFQLLFYLYEWFYTILNLYPKFEHIVHISFTFYVNGSTDFKIISTFQMKHSFYHLPISSSILTVFEHNSGPDLGCRNFGLNLTTY